MNLSKKNIVTFFLLLTVFDHKAQWINADGFNSVSDYNAISLVSRDVAGNVYASGSFFTKQPLGGYFISKWDGLLWSKIAVNDESIYSQCTDQNGNLYMASTTAPFPILKWNGAIISKKLIKSE